MTIKAFGNPFSAANIRQYRNTVPSSVITNTTSESAFDVFMTIAANALKVGTCINLRYFGIYSTAVAPPSLTKRIRFGGLTGTSLLSSGSITSLPSLGSNLGIAFQGDFRVISVGATGSIECHGVTTLQTAVGIAVTANASNTAPITIDTTVASDFVATMQMGSASSSNQFQLRVMTVDIWDP